MSEVGKLKKAVEITISAGFQLNKEAFELLNTLAKTEDPASIIIKALTKINELKEKPAFIDRVFLETITKETNKVDPNQGFVNHSTPKKQVYPYAKEVESDVKIIDDPTKKIGSKGTTKDFLEYFRDRYKRMEKMLRKRFDIKNARSIKDVLKASTKTKTKIICMITEKREVNQKIFLTVEDLHATAVILISQNAPEKLRQKARMLFRDQVVCLSIIKTQSKLLIAEDIIYPNLTKKVHNKTTIPIYAAFTSDLHVGSSKFQEVSFNRFIQWLNGKYGNNKMKEIARHVKYVFVAGDIVDGIGVYPNQEKELTIKDIYKQYETASKYITQIPDYIEIIIIPGNHDASRKALPQPAISNKFLQPLTELKNIYSLGNPSYLSVHNFEVLVYHGRSIDDVNASISSIDSQKPDKAMQILLQSRHLAPMYGGKTLLSPEKRDFLVIENVPNIFHAGHVHVLGYNTYRGVCIINSGCWQAQTEYMKRLGVVPTPGKVPVVNLQTSNLKILSFN